LHSLGWALHELGRTTEGPEHLKEALRIQTALGETRRRAWTAFALASAHTALDRHAEALDCYLLADFLFVELNLELGITATRAMLATTYSNLGHDEDAVRSAHDALTRAQRQNSKPLLSLAHHRLGLLLLQHKEPRTALAHLDAALVVRRDSRERWGEAETLLARAETLVLLGKSDQARWAYVEAADILRSLEDPRALDIRSHIAALNASRRNDRNTSL
jgi:tetratricopeptide (TPR) repeat protein